MKEDDKLALVTELHGNRGMLWSIGSGFLPFLKKKQAAVVVGDFVNYEELDESSVLINNILDPANQVERLNKKGFKQNIVNNVTQILLVVAAEPKPNYLLIDKLILISELINCQLLIVLNKIDLESEWITKELHQYSNLNYDVIKISAKSNINIAEFIHKLNNHRSVLVGQSGVGKSTITNLLLSSDDIKTRSLSGRSKKGKHTTTTTKLHLLNNNSFLIDTPGVENLHPNLKEIHDIKKGFIEIHAQDFKCKYRDCSHTEEPSCVVKEMVRTSQISQERYRNYKKLIATYF